MLSLILSSSQTLVKKKKKRAKQNKQTQNLNRLKKDEKTLSQGEFKRKCSTAIDKGDYSFFLPLWNHKL